MNIPECVKVVSSVIRREHVQSCEIRATTSHLILPGRKGRQQAVVQTAPCRTNKQVRNAPGGTAGPSSLDKNSETMHVQVDSVCRLMSSLQ